MKIIYQALLLITVNATCADSGVNPPTLVELNGSCLNDGSFAVQQKGKAFDCDPTPSKISYYQVPFLTPINTTCTVSSYTLSKTPITYSTLPQQGPDNVNPTLTLPVNVHSHSSGIRLVYSNDVSYFLTFYFCAVFNDNSIFCHPQEHGIVILCDSSLGMQYTTSQSTQNFVFQPSDAKVIDFPSQINTIFQFTDACSGVQMYRYGVYIDSSLTTPFTDDAIFQLADRDNPSSTKMTVTSSTALNFQTFYITAENRAYDKSKSAILAINIYICGFEGITSSSTSISITETFAAGIGVKTIDHSTVSGLLSSTFTSCPITYYELITDQMTGALLGGTSVTVDATNLYVDTSQTISSPLWLRVSTSGRGGHYDIPVNIYICGFETITASSPISSITATYQENTGIHLLDHTAQTNLLSSSWPDCPIIADKQFIISTSSTVLAGTQFSADATNIVIDSINAFDQPLSLRIFTLGGSYFDIPLDIMICDDALIGSVDSSIIIQKTYALNTGIQSYDVNEIQEAIRPAINRCPLVFYDIVDENYAPYVNTNLYVAANLVQSDTSDLVAVNYEQYYLRAYMEGSTIKKHIPIDFHFCGAESVIVENGEANKEIVFVKSAGVQNYDLLELMSKFISTDPKCPVFSYDLYGQDKSGPYSGLQNVQIVNNELQIETQSAFNLTLQLRASTQFGLIPNYAQITIIGCGAESFVSQLPSELKLIYKKASKIEEYSLSEIKQKLKSDVSKCPITGYSLIVDRETRKAYDGNLLSLDQDFIKIDISKPAQKTVYLEANTLGNQKFYVPIALSIWEEKQVKNIKVDRPPYFTKTPQQSLIISNYSGKFIIPNIEDDYDQFYCIQITSQTLGSPQEFKNMSLLFAVNGTKEDTLPQLKGKNLRQIIHYNHFTKEVSIIVPDDLQHLYTGFHSLNIRLFDIFGQSQDYHIVIKFSDHQDKEAKIEKIKKTYFEGNDKKVMAKIIDIDYFGNMTIMFSTPMKTHDINITHINSSICDIYVEPQDNWHKNIDDFNMSRLNLTWNVTGYEKDQMNISLKFNNPVDISPKIEQDRIVFHILDLQYFFISETQLIDLSYEYHTLKYPIRKQMIPTEYAKQFVDTVQTASNSLLLSQPVLFVLNFFMVFLLSHVFGMINSLQIIVHIVLVSVIFPANIVTFLSFMIPVVQFDIFEQVNIPSQWFQESKSIDYDGLSPVNIMNQLQNLNYDTHNPILNLGSIGIFIAIYVIKLVLLFSIKPISKSNPKLQRFYLNQYNSMIFGEIASLIFEGLFELMISVYLTFQVTESENFEKTKVLSYMTIACIILVVLVALPIALTWLIFQDLKAIQEIQTLKKFHLGVSTQSKKYIMFYQLFFLRRFFYLSICIFIVKYNFFQAQLFSILNLSMICYQANYKPLTTPKRNYTELFNEIIIYMCFLHLFLFSDFVPDNLNQYEIGWFFIFLVSLFIFIHVIQLFYRIYQFIMVYSIQKDIIGKIKKIIISQEQKKQETKNEQANDEALSMKKNEQAEQDVAESGPPIKRMNCQKKIEFPDFDEIKKQKNKYQFKKRKHVQFKGKKKLNRRMPSRKVNPTIAKLEESRQSQFDNYNNDLEEEKVEEQQQQPNSPTEEDYQRYDWFKLRERQRLYGVTQEMEDRAFKELCDHINQEWDREYAKKCAEREKQRQQEQYHY